MDSRKEARIAGLGLSAVFVLCMMLAAFAMR